MRIFSKKDNPIEIAKRLDSSYKKLMKEACVAFKELHEDTVVSENVVLEIAYLLFFAFAYGIVTNCKETDIRNKIRDAFCDAIPFNKVEYETVNLRGEEYFNVLRTEADQDKRALHFGNVFAKHTGYEENIFIVSFAWIQYMHAVKLTHDLINNPTNA